MTVKTANKWFAGTDNTVKINIVGAAGQTQFLKLTNSFQNNFEAGKTDEFHLKAASVGK